MTEDSVEGTKYPREEMKNEVLNKYRIFRDLFEHFLYRREAVSRGGKCVRRQLMKMPVGDTVRLLEHVLFRFV